MTSSPEINTALAPEIPVIQPAQDVFVQPENSHMSGDTIPARLLNKVGRAMHLLSTLPSDRPSRQEYYAGQPATVREGVRRVCRGLSPTALYVKIQEFGDDIESNIGAALGQPTEDLDQTDEAA